MGVIASAIFYVLMLWGYTLSLMSVDSTLGRIYCLQPCEGDQDAKNTCAGRLRGRCGNDLQGRRDYPDAVYRCLRSLPLGWLQRLALMVVPVPIFPRHLPSLVAICWSSLAESAAGDVLVFVFALIGAICCVAGVWQEGFAGIILRDTVRSFLLGRFFL
jgi:hypothetical protein